MLSYEPFVGNIFIVPTKQLIFSIRPSSWIYNIAQELNMALIHVFYYSKCIFSELIFQYHLLTRPHMHRPV